MAGRDDDDVGTPHVRGEVARPRVAHGHGGVLSDQQESGGHPDDRGPADHDRVTAGDLDPGPPQDLDRGVRCRRQEPVVTQAEETRVQRMDPIDVLRRIDGVDDGAHPDRRRQRHLDDDAIHLGSAFSSRTAAVTRASVASPSSSTKPASMPTLAQPRRIRSR